MMKGEGPGETADKAEMDAKSMEYWRKVHESESLMPKALGKLSVHGPAERDRRNGFSFAIPKQNLCGSVCGKLSSRVKTNLI